MLHNLRCCNEKLFVMIIVGIVARLCTYILANLVLFMTIHVFSSQAAEPEKTEEATARSEDQQQEQQQQGETEKSYAIDGSLLSQLTKSKEQTQDPVARNTQSVTLNVDTLKGLLKKSNDGVSLAKLLNKQPDDAVVNTQEEDPGQLKQQS